MGLRQKYAANFVVQQTLGSCNANKVMETKIICYKELINLVP